MAVLGDEGDPRHGLHGARPGRPLTAPVTLGVAGVTAALEEMRARWLAACESGPEREWVWDPDGAEHALAAFSHLRVRAGRRVGGFRRADSDRPTHGAHGHGHIFGWPADHHPPRLPGPLEIFLHGWAPPGALGVDEALEGDGTPEGWLELAVALTHLWKPAGPEPPSLLFHTLIDAPPEEGDGTMERPTWDWRRRPESFAPVVGRDGDATAVRFATCSQYLLSQGVWRHDWTFVGGAARYRHVRLADTAQVFRV